MEFLKLKIKTDFGEYTARFEGDKETGYVGWLSETPIVVSGGCVHECILEIEKSLDSLANYEIAQLLK